MPKWGKTIIAILLLPVCVGAAKALWLLLKAGGGADTTWVPALGGAACWLVVYLSLPKPMRLYVLGHELTHALWAMACGGKVLKFRVGAAGGHVVVTKNNFLIALAPYFFPLYAVLVAICFVAGHWIWGWADYLVWFHLLLGAAYSFHITLTGHILQTHQTDISSQGYLFSVVVIYLGNISIMLVSLPLLIPELSWESSLKWSGQETLNVLRWFWHLFF